MQFVDTETACRILRINEQELNAAVRDGLLHTTRLGTRTRYLESDVEGLYEAFGLDTEDEKDRGQVKA
jgi:hypothetical protein